MKKKPVLKPTKKAPSKPQQKSAASKPVIAKPVKKPVVQKSKPAPQPVKAVKAPVKVLRKEADKKQSSKNTDTKVSSKVSVKEAIKPMASSKSIVKESPKVSVKEVRVEKKAEKITVKPVVEETKINKAQAKEDKKASKKNTTKKTEEPDLEDDFVSDDDFGIDEIGEYEEELKAVEALDEETEEIEITFDTKEKNDVEVVLTDAEGRRYCRVRECDQVSTVDSYCRYHYLFLWKKIQVRKKILAGGKLERYIEELTSRYPDKFLEVIRKDLRTEKDFLAAIQEMEIDESLGENELEEDTQSFIEEVRGLGDASPVEDDEY